MRLVAIGLTGILIFFLALGLSFVPEIGAAASSVLRVPAILGIVGLYELVVCVQHMFAMCRAECVVRAAVDVFDRQVSRLCCRWD